MQRSDRIAITLFGDGATSEGDFHEAMNFAANLDIPVVFFCQNNHWAISVPGKIQCSAPTVAQRGIAYGMDCLRCDGNDLFAVVHCMNQAIKSAREHNRPTFIEAVTYRLGDHTTADDARRYRDAEEVALWKERDPITRLKNFLKSKGLWNDSKQADLDQRAEADVAAVVERAEGIEPPEIGSIFDWTYAQLPTQLIRQRDTMRTSSIGQDPSQIQAEETSAG
jgi:pyruvate dehydrogenase E1 component alpha subunit